MSKIIPISDEDLQLFARLLNELSPENIAQDGLRSRVQVNVARKQIMVQWHALEHRIGRKVGDSEVYTWQLRRR